jgi:biotin transport system substrate-specific component
MKLKEMLLIVASVFLIIVGSYVTVPVGPVPFVLTNFFIVLLGLLLGWRITLFAVITYILLGSIGLPVFSQGRGGFAHVIGVTGGFILGFIPLAFISGLGKDKHIIIKGFFAILGTGALFTIGIPMGHDSF